MTTLITGAGLIAAHVGRELQTRGEQVVFYDHAPSNDYLSSVLDVSQVPLYSGDITNLPEISAVLQKHNATCIVHAAGLIGAQVSRQPYRGVQVNVDGTVAVAEAARLMGIRRLIFCSTMAIYDFEKLSSGVSISEDAPLGPKNLYGATKVACEQLLNQYGGIYDIQVVNLRLAGVFGRGQYTGGSWIGRILNRALEAALDGRAVTIKPEWFGTNEYVYVKDVARAFAIACLAEEDVCGPFNIGTGVLHGFDDLIAELRAVLPNLKIEIQAPQTPFASYLVRDQAFDISKAQCHLGYAPQYTLRSGLIDYLRELQEFAGRYERLD